MENNENRDNYKILIIAILSVVTFILVSIGATYAFYNATIIGNEDNGDVRIQTAQVFAVFEATNSIDENSVLPGWSDSMEFTIQNVTDAENAYGNYSLVWNIETNEIDDNSFTYSLVGETYKNNTKVTGTIDNNEVINIGKTRVPTVSTVLGTGTINSGITHKYTLTIKFKETGQDQNELQYKKFKSTVSAIGEPTI